MTALLALAFALTFTGIAGAAVLDVCAAGCTYSTVKGAVAAASSGDVVELANETFNEGGITIDENITVRSASGMAVIDAGSYGWVFKIASAAVVDLEDLRLEGGTYCRLDNSGEVTLSTVYVLGNGTSQPSTLGGIVNWGSASMTITASSIVAYNASHTYGTSTFGGGITNYGDLVISGYSTVFDNRGVNGGGLHNDGGTVSVLSSYFYANEASNKGGAWANVDSSSGTVAFHSSSTAAGNLADVDCDVSWDNVSSSCVN